MNQKNNFLFQKNRDILEYHKIKNIFEQRVNYFLVIRNNSFFIIYLHSIIQTGSGLSVFVEAYFHLCF
jgi:hypothetical protein